MYTAEACYSNQDPADKWDIYDADGDWMCTVENKSQADSLLTHLNLGHRNK